MVRDRNIKNTIYEILKVSHIGAVIIMKIVDTMKLKETNVLT